MPRLIITLIGCLIALNVSSQSFAASHQTMKWDQGESSHDQKVTFFFDFEQKYVLFHDFTTTKPVVEQMVNPCLDKVMNGVQYWTVPVCDYTGILGEYYVQIENQKVINVIWKPVIGPTILYYKPLAP